MTRFTEQHLAPFKETLDSRKIKREGEKSRNTYLASSRCSEFQQRMGGASKRGVANYLQVFGGGARY